MKIGINTCLWEWPFNYKRIDLFKKIEDIGYNAVELTIENRNRKNLEKIKNSLEKTSLECIICSSFLSGNIISEKDEIVNKGKKYIIESIDMCEYLGSKILVGPTYGIYINKDFLSPHIKSRAINQCTRILEDIGNYANEKKIKIAIEPLNRYESNFLNTAKEGLDLLSKINLKNVGLNLDTYHMNIEEKNIEKAILYSGKFLFHLHVTENDRGTPGSGHIDWASVSNSLKKINFNGFVVMESGNPNVEKLARAGFYWRQYDWTQDKMAEEGYKFIKHVFT